MSGLEDCVDVMIKYENDMRELPKYVEAVDKGMKLALTHDSSAAGAMAQVLLSAYNSYNYHLAVADLGSLDGKYLDIALKIIYLRSGLMKEPQELIENGDAVFKDLQDRWPEFHVDKRNQA